MESIEHPSAVVALINALLGLVGIHVPDHIAFVALITLFVLVIGLAIRSQLSVENPGKLQIVLEDLVSFLVAQLESQMGKRAASTCRCSAPSSSSS